MKMNNKYKEELKEIEQTTEDMEKISEVCKAVINELWEEGRWEEPEWEYEE